MKKKELSLNEKPFIKSYTHNAFINSILTSPLISGDNVVRFQILNDSKEYSILEHGCKTVKGEEISVISPIENEKGYSFVYSACEKEDSITIKVNFHRMNCSYESICLVLDEEQGDAPIDIEKCFWRFNCPFGGKMYFNNRGEILGNDNCKRIMEPLFFLRLKRKNLDIVFEYSYNGKKWYKVYDDKLPKRIMFTKLRIGVLTDIRNNYMNWYCCNYIQTYLDSPQKGKLIMDYYWGGSKQYKAYGTNQFLSVYTDCIDPDRITYQKLHDYLKEKINNDEYVVLEINHFWIPETGCYQRYDYFHEVLVYGVDFRNKRYKMMGYDENNDVFLFYLSFRTTWKSLHKKDIRVFLLKIDLNLRCFDVDTEAIKKRAMEYLTGAESRTDVSDCVARIPVMCYGIETLSQITENEENLFAFCNDTRLSYFVYEHKVQMLKRVKYLMINGYFSEDAAELINLCEENVKTAEKVKNMILINATGLGKKMTMDKVEKGVKKILENEREAYRRLIEILK